MKHGVSEMAVVLSRGRGLGMALLNALWMDHGDS